MRKTLKRAEKRSKRIINSPVAPEGELIGHVVFKETTYYKFIQFTAYFGRRMVIQRMLPEHKSAASVRMFCDIAYKILVKELMRGRYTPKRYYDNER